MQEQSEYEPIRKEINCCLAYNTGDLALQKGEVSGVCVIELQTTILPGRAISTETTLHFSPMPLSGLLTLLGDLGLQEVTVTILPLEESPKPPGQIIFGFQSIDRHHRFLP